MRRKRRKLKLKIKNISLLILFIVILTITICLINRKDKEENILKEDIKEEKIKEYKLSLVMVGDALINDYLYNDANKNANYKGYDFKPYLKLIKERVKEYDLAYYNQETILGGTSIGLSSYPSFNSPYEVGDAMIDAGFNIVSLATNHTMDRGEKAILNSREYWNKQANIYSIGSYSSLEEKNTIESKVYEKNNITYAILNYTYGTNGIKVPQNKDYLVNVWPLDTNLEGYKQNVLNDIKKLRDKVDVLIVAMHWGIEYNHKITDTQKKVAKFLADNGVDIIIGTHPHVIEPIEWIDDTIVFYSLGNFLSSQTSDSCTNLKCNIGLMSSVEITKNIDKEETKMTINNIKNELIYMYNKNYHDYLIIPFSNNLIKDYLPNYEQVYNNYKKIIESNDSRIKTVAINNEGEN